MWVLFGDEPGQRLTRRLGCRFGMVEQWRVSGWCGDGVDDLSKDCRTGWVAVSRFAFNRKRLGLAQWKLAQGDFSHWGAKEAAWRTPTTESGNTIWQQVSGKPALDSRLALMLDRIGHCSLGARREEGSRAHRHSEEQRRPTENNPKTSCSSLKI